MNRYEVRISGKVQPIPVRASKASIAMARALKSLTDSQFLNSMITIRFLGRVPKLYHIKAYESMSDYSRHRRTVATNLPSREAAQAEIKKLRTERPSLEHFTIISSLEGERI